MSVRNLVVTFGSSFARLTSAPQWISLSVPTR